MPAWLSYYFCSINIHIIYTYLRISFTPRLESNAGHDEDDGKLKQALDAGEPGVLHT